MATLCVCFYWEEIGLAVERGRLPHLTGEPLALAGPESAVVLASAEARQRGVGAGQLLSAARSLCPDLVALPYDRPAYEDAAHPLRDALAALSETVEPDGPETCYALLDGRTALADARHLAEEVSRRAGAVLSVGLGRTKLLARRAARHDGEGTIFHVPAGDETAFLASVPLSDFDRKNDSGLLDHKTRQAFARCGVKTLGDILSLPPHRLPKALRKVGKQLWQWAQGHDADPVKALWPPRTLSSSHRFEDETDNRLAVEYALKALVVRLACGLTLGREFAREVTLGVGLADHSFLTETERLGLPQSQASPLYAASLRLLSRLPIQQAVLSLELRLGDLGAGSGAQLSLLDAHGGGAFPEERKRRLEAVLIHLRKRYGPRAVMTARLLMSARRIHLWTFPLGHLLDEEVRVGTDGEGTPLYYLRTAARRGRAAGRYDVTGVQNRWRETAWRGKAVLTDRDVWRVVTDPFGVSELHQLEAQWRLTASWD